MWSFLPDEATRFVVAAVRPLGPDAFSEGQAGRAVPGREAVGLQLMSLIFGLGGGQRVPDALAGAGADPERLHWTNWNTSCLRLSRESARASAAAGVIATFYRQRAGAGDVEALVDWADSL